MISYTLYAHQKEAIDYALNHNYSINSMAMGCGKTLVAIELIKRTGLRALVVAPSSLLNTWKSELEKFSKLKVNICKKYQPTKEGVVSICSYSSLKKTEKLFDEVDLVIADEVHYLKNLDTKRTRYFHEYLEKYSHKRFLGLTGTPIKNRIVEWFSLIALCSYNPEDNSGENISINFPNYWKFARTFCFEKTFMVRGRRVTKFEGHRNVDRLKILLEGKYFRVRASDVLDLPPLTRKDILIDTDSIDHDLLRAWEEGNKNKSFMKSKVNSAMIKVPHTVKYVKDLQDQGETPILIFSAHVDSAKDIAKRLNFPYITGATSMEDRNILVDKFQEGNLPGLSATIGALSVGVTLTRASNLIFNDLPFVPGDIAQAEKRIHRIGTTKHCTIHRILWGKVDIHICKALDKKIETLVEVL